MEGLPRFLAWSLAAFLDDAVHRLRVGRITRSALADRPEELFERDDQLLLHLDVADRALAIAALQILDLLLVWVEGVVVGKNGIPLHPSRRRRGHAVRVGVHPPHFLLDRLRIVSQEDRVPVALPHLPGP